MLSEEISDELFFPGMWAGKCAWSSPRRDHFWGNRFPSARLTPLFWVTGMRDWFQAGKEAARCYVAPV